MEQWLGYFHQAILTTLPSFVKIFQILIYTILPALIPASPKFRCCQNTARLHKAKYSAQSIYQDIDDAPEANHHEQADDAVNHQVFHLVSPFLVFSSRNVFQYSIKKKTTAKPTSKITT